MPEKPKYEKPVLVTFGMFRELTKNPVQEGWDWGDWDDGCCRHS